MVGERARTRDLVLPKHVRYQATLLPEPGAIVHGNVADFASTRGRPSQAVCHRQSAQRQGNVQSPPHVAIQVVGQQLFRSLEAIGDGPVGQVESARCLATIAACIDVDLQRLDQLLAHPGVGQERAKLPLDDRRGEVRVAQQEALDAELGHVVDHAVDGRSPWRSVGSLVTRPTCATTPDSVGGHGDGHPARPLGGSSAGAKHVSRRFAEPRELLSIRTQDGDDRASPRDRQRDADAGARTVARGLPPDQMVDAERQDVEVLVVDPRVVRRRVGVRPGEDRDQSKAASGSRP